MPLVSHTPRHPLLSGLVSRVWCALPDASHRAAGERILPTARPQVIISNGPTGAIYVGPKSTSTEVGSPSGHRMTGAAFEVGASMAFTGVAADQTTDLSIPLDCLWPIHDLAGELASLTPREAMDRLENELVRRLRPELIDRSVLAAQKAISAGVPAGRVAAAIGHDRRKFVPEFRRHVGFGPKQYERIQRFSYAITAIRQPNPASIASIAVDLGFADQAHLTREVTHFAGVTPGVLHADGSNTPNHIAHDKIFKT